VQVLPQDINETHTLQYQEIINDPFPAAGHQGIPLTITGTTGKETGFIF